MEIHGPQANYERRLLADEFRLTEDERNAKLPSHQIDLPTQSNRIAGFYLREASLADLPREQRFRSPDRPTAGWRWRQRNTRVLPFTRLHIVAMAVL